MMTFSRKRHLFADGEPLFRPCSTFAVLRLAVLPLTVVHLTLMTGSVLFATVGYSQESNYSREVEFAGMNHPTTVADATIEQLIADLGDPHYIVRDEAEAQILRIGGPAIAFLRRALSHGNAGDPDSEIRLRATRLLILIERSEHERKIREFLNGDYNELDLPGWSDFSAITGDDKVSRKLFVDMHQAQPNLLAAIKTGKKQVEELYQQVAKRSLQTSSRANVSQSVATMITMLFVSTLELASDHQVGRNRIAVGDVDLKRLQSVVVQPQMVTLVNRGGNKTQIRRLISNWLTSLSQSETASINVQLSVIGAYELKDRIGEVTSFASNRDLPTTSRVNSIIVFGQLATPADSKKLEKLFGDKTVLGNFIPRSTIATTEFHSDRSKLMQVQFCDLALATAVKIWGLDVTSFGFDPNCFSGEKLVPNQAGFFSEDDRKAAFAKWSKRKVAK